MDNDNERRETPPTRAGKRRDVGDPHPYSAPDPTASRPIPTAQGGNARPMPTQQGGNARPTPTQQGGNARPMPTAQSGGTRPTPTPQGGNARPTQMPQGAGTRPTQTPQGGNDRPTQTPQGGNARPTQTPQGAGTRPTQTPQGAPRRPARQQSPAPRPTRSIPTVEFDATRTSDTLTARDRARKKKRSEAAEHFHEEGNNAVMSIVKAAIYLVAVLIVSVLISMAVILVGNDMFAFVKEDREVTVVVPEGTTVKELSHILGDAGLVRYPSAFKLYADHKTKDNKNFATLEFVSPDYEFPKDESGKEKTAFIAGTYNLNSSMDYEDLLWSFLPAPKTGTSWVTIPEGFTTDEIIDLLVSKGIGEREKYVEVINTGDFSDFWFVAELEESGAWNAEEYAQSGKVSSGRIYRLDGYLFPDTYEFYNASREETVIKKMLHRFSQIYNREYREMTEKQGFTTDELITLASMIEKEAGRANDFFNVSEVFRNRLNAPAYFPYLQSDATVLYEIHHETGTRPKHVTHEDTELQVPYNTYTNEGLPPGPIANPSATAVLAALNPSNEGYYYFVSGPERTYFATNEWQHNYNVSVAAAEWEAADNNG